METKKELTYVSRNDKILNEYDFWKEMKLFEAHHDHKIIYDKKLKKFVWETTYVGKYDLNKIMSDFAKRGLTKNSEEVRALLRSIGYSLYGYWEVVYWEVNNNDVKDYIPNKIP